MSTVPMSTVDIRAAIEAFNKVTALPPLPPPLTPQEARAFQEIFNKGNVTAQQAYSNIRPSHKRRQQRRKKDFNKKQFITQKCGLDLPS